MPLRREESGSADNPRGATATGQPRQVLGLHQTVAIIVGIVIGAGIFKAPSLVAGMAGGTTAMFVAWVLGGVMSLIGALCYAELATAFPSAGGDYHFLRRAYGPRVSFLFAWARFSVITTGSIALLAFVFGDYLNQVVPLGASGPPLYAAAVIIVLSWINLRGIGSSATAQTWLTLLEVGGLLLIMVAGLYLAFGGGAASAAGAAQPAPAAGAQAAAATIDWSMFGMAMVFVLLTYGGWNEAAYISAEVKGGSRNMVVALVSSILLITVLYLVVNWAYWTGLGLAGMGKSQAIAADLLQVAFGPTGSRIISILVAVAALTSINATMIVGARTSFAVGRDWPQLARLGRWDAERGTPTVALLLQSGIALVLVPVGAWVGSGFRAMVEFTAPVFWLFFLLSGVSLFVLRVREPRAERPFRVPLYPLLPLIFCAVCAYMLWASLSYVYSQELGGLNAAWIGIAVLATGALLLLVISRAAAKAPREA
ncbi:MAG: amino acid permease [Burkholderiaceae bacterium]